jgi:putative ABC transport system permease protein
MNILRQCLSVCRFSLLGLPHRRLSALVIVVGMGCVVGVLLAMLSVAAGLLRANSAGDPRLVLVLPQSQALSPAAVATILDAPGIARDADGKPLADGELWVQIPPAEGFVEGSLGVQGIGPAGLKMRSQFQLASGRMYRAGLHELLMGAAGSRKFHLQIGDAVIMPDGDWRIVGIFTEGGGPLESRLLADRDTLMASLHTDSVGNVLLQPENPAAYGELKQWLTSNPSLTVNAQTQAEYFLSQISGSARFFTIMAYTVGAMLATGAVFGAVNIMYGAVTTRTREIGTLRSMGYDAVPIAVSVLLEAILLSLLGGTLGAGAAWFTCNGQLNMNGTAIFENYVSARLFAIGIGWAVLLGLLGALFPAIRAARLTIVDALHVT